MAVHVAHKGTSKARQRIGGLVQRARVSTTAVDDLSVSSAFDRLGRGWHRIDSIRWPGQALADVDYVLAGPPGIFVVDARESSRALDRELALLRQNGPTQGGVGWGVAAAAHAVGSLLGMSERRPTPMLCIVGGKEIAEVEGPVLVFWAATVAARLTSMPRVYEDAEIAHLANRLRSCLMPITPAAGAIPNQRHR